MASSGSNARERGPVLPGSQNRLPVTAQHLKASLVPRKSCRLDTRE